MYWYTKMNETLVLPGSRERNNYYSNLHINRDELTLLNSRKFWEDFLAEVMSELSLEGSGSFWAEK